MTLEEAIEDIRHLPFERMHSFDANLEWLGSSDGTEVRIDDGPKDGAAIIVHNHPSPGAYGLSVIDVVVAATRGLYATFVYNSDWIYGWYMEPINIPLIKEKSHRAFEGHPRSGVPMIHYDVLVRSGVSVYCWPWPEGE